MHYHTKTAILLVLFIAFSAICMAQKTEERFRQLVLENPIAHSSWFDKHFPVTEILQYAPFGDTSTVFLFNGYASHKLVSPSSWTLKRTNAIPLRVQIVFTKQPFDKKDWKTNYYELLASRITGMLLIDSTLNTMDVKWEIILQTQAKSRGEAEKLPHGIAITYKVAQNLKIEAKQVKSFIAETPNEIERCINETKDSSYSMPNKLTDDELKAILYPKSVTESSAEWQKPQNNAKRKEPGCPTFKSNMQKPRRGLISRIFR